MTPTNREELKPCPFCGGEAHMTEASYTKSGELAQTSIQIGWSQTYATYAVSCERCDIGMTNPYLNANAAIAAWNRRANHPVDAGLGGEK